MIISVIIPTFGQWELTKQCLLSLKQHTQFPIEVILVNNAVNVLLDDETHHEAPLLGNTLFGDNFVYLPQEQNTNFAGACNIGARKARTNLLFFLNNDTGLTENWLLPLLEDFSKGSAHKMLAPLLLFPPDDKGLATIQHIGVYYTGRQVGHIYSGFPEKHRITKRKRSQNCITAAAFLITKEDFLALDAFDENFKNGFEDVDFCARFNKAYKNNMDIAVLPQSKIYHYCSMSQGRSDNEVQNSNLLYSKHNNLLFTPNYHTLLEEDGYELKVDFLLDLTPDLNQRHKDSLIPILQRNDKDEIIKNLIKEPFWEEGFWALMQHEAVSLDDKLALAKTQMERNPSQQLILSCIEFYANADCVSPEMIGLIELLEKSTHAESHYKLLSSYKGMYQFYSAHVYKQLEELEQNYTTRVQKQLADFTQKIASLKACIQNSVKV